MTLTLAIIADDLTGALDAAAPFAARGLRTEVALTPAATRAAIASGAEVIAVSTNSREIPADAARQAVAETLAALPPGIALFKKIDSRMKGNIAAELAAFPPGPLLVAPAIPDFGRFTENDHVVGFGVNAPIPVGIDAFVPDVRSAEDMLAALDGASGAMPVGARGLAEALAIRMTNRAPVPAAICGPRGILVIGSRDPITLAQVAALDAAHVPAPNGVIGTVPDAAITVIQAVAGKVEIAPEAVAANLARGLGTLPRPDMLFITGGATAAAVLGAMGIHTLHLLGEVLPGLPVAQSGNMTIVAKSGGFGDAGTLADLVQRLA